MRVLLIAGVALVAVLLVARPVPAYEGPWCTMMSMGDGGIYEDCHYASFEACRPNVLAGNRGFCNQNRDGSARRTQSHARETGTRPAAIDR
jgi:hypothetical protein